MSELEAVMEVEDPMDDDDCGGGCCKEDCEPDYGLNSTLHSFHYMGNGEPN